MKEFNLISNLKFPIDYDINSFNEIDSFNAYIRLYSIYFFGFDNFFKNDLTLTSDFKIIY